MARKEDLPVPWTVSRRAIVTAARSFLGVPYRHQGRSARGVDCSGLLVLICGKLNIPMIDAPGGYSPQPTGDMLIRPCEEQCWKPENQTELLPGDIAVFWGPNPREPQHFGIVGDGRAHKPTLIHSFSKYGKVVEHGWNPYFHKRFYCRYWFPGVEDGGFV